MLKDNLCGVSIKGDIRMLLRTFKCSDLTKKSYFSVVCSSHSSTTVFPCAVCYHKPGIMAGSLSAMMGQLRFLMPTGFNFRTAKGSYLASEHVSTATQYSWFTVLCPSSHHTPLCSSTFDHTISQVASLASHSPGQTRNSEVSGAEVFVYFPRTLSQRPVSLSNVATPQPNQACSVPGQQRLP